MIRIASGLLQDGNNVLLIQRNNTRFYDRYWAFPGGRVESNENLESAIRRELQEEVGVTVNKLDGLVVFDDMRGLHAHFVAKVLE